jgi:hypothetical protein
MSDDLSGPHLQAAFLCEKVLQEAHGVFSFIRVVDRFIRPKPSAIPAGAQVLPIQVMLVVSFKVGGIGTGTYKIKILGHRPNPTAPPLMEIENEMFCEGGPDSGLAVISQITMALDEEGLYWIDVLFEDRMVTRIPFRVLFASGVPTSQPPRGAL